MLRYHCWVLTLVCFLTGVDGLSAQHAMLVQGANKLAIVDRHGAIDWQIPWGEIHDLHVLKNGNILAQQGWSKLSEIDRKTKMVVWSYDAKGNGNEKRPVEIHSFQPNDDGTIMIAESGPGRIIEIDRSGQILRQLQLKVDRPNAHTDTRLVRKLANGNYLCCQEGDGSVREYDPSGTIVWEYEIPFFGQTPHDGHGPEAFGNKCFAAVRLENGHTLITTGNGHSILEVRPDKEIVWQIHQHDLPGITLAWVTTLEVLSNGNYLFGNCHAGPGQPLVIELEPKSKKVVWTFDHFQTFGNSVSNTRRIDE